MSAINRIKEIIDYKSMSVRAFERLINVSNNSIQAAIKRNAGVKDDTLNKILQRIPEIDPIWLLTGEGSMLIHGGKENTIGGQVTNRFQEKKDKIGSSDELITDNNLTDGEKEIISNAFLLHPEEVLKIPAVKKWHEAEMLECENKLMREFVKLRQSK